MNSGSAMRIIFAARSNDGPGARPAKAKNPGFP